MQNYHNFSEMVTINLFSPSMIGSLYQVWYQQQHGKNVNLNGFPSKKSSSSIINGLTSNPKYLEKYFQQPTDSTGIQ